MRTLHRRAVYGALVTFLACHSAAVDAVTLATAQNSISASVSLTGLPDTAGCLHIPSGPATGEAAGGHGYAIATTNTPSDTAACVSSSPGSFSMSYSGLLQSAESGLLIDSGFGGGAAGYGFGQEMQLRGSGSDGMGFGFLVEDPLTLSLSYDVSVALAISTTAPSALVDSVSASNASASGSIILDLCKTEPILLCMPTLIAWQPILTCGPTEPGDDPCVLAVSGTESRVLDVVIPESGFWFLLVRSHGGGQARAFRIPEPSSFALLLLGLLGMAAGRCARDRLA